MSLPKRIENEETNTPLMPELPRLPIPPLRETLSRYLARVEPLLEDQQNRKTRECVLSNNNLKLMHKLQQHLLEYDRRLAKEKPQSSYIEDFWYDAYLMYEASVVLNVNPCFLLEDDRTIKNVIGCYNKYTCQIKRAAKLIFSILKFIKEIRHGNLKPDVVRGETPLSMDQYSRLFGCSRIPPGPREKSCHLQVDPTSHHVIVTYESQLYWFDVLDVDNIPIFSTPEPIEWNLYSIIMDSKQSETTRPPFGVFTTENRRIWSNVRDYIFHDSDSTNWKNLKIVDSALFVICLDDASFTEDSELIKSMLCGTSKIRLGPNGLAKPLDAQHGTCLNRWYDKLQLIVTKNGKAGINFEHTAVDGHTVLRLAADIYTDSILGFARGVTRNVPDVFTDTSESNFDKSNLNLITIPRKLEWKVDPFILSSLHFAETRVSDSVSQHEFAVLDFTQYGSNHIKASFQCSPDALVQQAFQVAYYALYGKFEATYEPAMTKKFTNGRTEAIRSITPESKDFVKSMFDRYAIDEHRIRFLKRACKKHSQIIKECSEGLGQDRHLYALYRIWNENFKDTMPLPPIFNDESWSIHNNTVISTSNCGNPCLKSFGFGPVTPNGFGIGYIVRGNAISMVISSRHRQTHRFASLIEHSLLEIDHVFQRRSAADSEVSTAIPSTRPGLGKLEQQRSNSLVHLLSGYNYFDVNVSG